jgi:hypothetical protein
MKNIYITLNSKIQSLLKLTENGFHLHKFEDYYLTYFRIKNSSINKLEYTIYPFDPGAGITHIRHSIVFPQINNILSKVVADFRVNEDTVIDRVGFQLSQELRNSIIIPVL